VAKAFGVTIGVDPRARAIMEENYKSRGIEMNEARLRMARIPAGGDLLKANQGPPGFTIGNVFVMAGVPSIMQVMLDSAAPMLKTGAKVLSETVRGDVREGDIGTELGEIAKQHPNVMIGSYPFFDEKTGPNTNLVIRSRDAGHLATARADVEAMLSRVRAALKVSV
jgi:molybdopterin-biosynthesis enzyme MoeA-like protein